MSGKGKVLFNSGLYTFSSILVKAIGFLLLPVYTLFLTPQDYGITNLVTSFNSVATIIVAFSLYSAVVRLYTEYKEDREKLKRFYGTVVTFVVCSGGVFCGLGFLFQALLIKWFFEGIVFYPVVVISLLTLTFVCLQTVHQSIMQGMQMGSKLTIINLTVFGLQVVLNLLFIGVFKLGVVGVLLATLIINLLYAVYMVFDLKTNNLIIFCMDKNLLCEALKYSIPLMPHELSTNIANFASRIFINNSGSLTSVGLYSVASQFGVIVDTVQSSVHRAFFPWFFEKMNQGIEEGKRDIVNLSQFLLTVYSLLYMGIGLFSQEVIILMTNERYVMSWTVIPILVMAYSLKSIYYFYVSVLFYYKEASKKIFIATITGSIFDIVLAAAFVPYYGMYAAAVTFLLAKVIVVSIVVAMSKRYDDIGYKVTGMLRIIAQSLLFMGIGLYFSYTKYMTVFSWINLFYKLCVLLVYLGFVYLTNRKTLSAIVNSGKIQQLLRRKISN